MNQASGSLYQSRIPVYPRSVKGRFRRFKTAVLVLAYGVYFTLPWVPWERPVGANQAVLFDIPDRHFYIFDLVVPPEDIFWLAGFLILAALLLFFVTGVVGRVFCGYFCFQTLWTDVFMFIERRVQGDRGARIRLDQAPWGGAKLRKKLTTHLLWLAVAFATGLTFVLYWGNADALVVQFFTVTAPVAAYGAAFLLTATTYTMAGLAREQVCTFMCPYARFQSAMFDRDTLNVSYDAARGEGRAKLGRETKTREARQNQGLGDCIDCGYCVQVCPTGIDIRNGLQLQCISCGLCIDACDTVMDSLGWPRGLIRYASERELEEGKKTRWLKPKTLGYGVAIALITSGLVYAMVNQSRLEVVVRQVRQPLMVQLADGRIQNSYEIKINNKTQEPLELALSQTGLPGGELDLAGAVETIQLAPQQRLRVLVRLKADPERIDAQDTFRFQLTAVQGAEAGLWEEPALFYAERR